MSPIYPQLPHPEREKKKKKTDPCRPRWHDQLNGITYFEYANPSHGLTGYDNSTVAYFRELGYNITYQDPLGGSTSHAISRLPNGNFLAQSDPRKWAGYGAAF